VPRRPRGREAARAQEPIDREARGEDRGLRVLGQGELVGRALEAQPAERLAERLVRFRERVAADRVRAGQRLTHADLLGSLTGEDEGNH
jgi:hypothetical protein